MVSCTSVKPAVMTKQAAETEIAANRKKIDVIDRQLVALLNRRAELAQLIGRARREAGIPASSAKQRQEEVLQKVMALAEPPGTPEATRHVYECIIAEMVAMQTRDQGSGRKQDK